MTEFEKLKKTRTFLRSAITKITNNIEAMLNNDTIDFNTLEETLHQLNLKSNEIKETDKKIEPLLNIDEYDTEIETTFEYLDKINLTSFRAQKKLKENGSNISMSNKSTENFNPLTTNSNKTVKLPKLNIQKYYGEYTQYINFWNTFKVSVNDNESLSKVEKFNYLRSYLGGSALNAIEGLEISESNYETALKILENRFGNKDIIINHHMNNLLNLNSVFKSSDISKLKRLHDEIEINVRSLSTLGLEPRSYSAMLIPVILKLLPADLTLEYNKQNIKESSTSDINKLLDFLQIEIKSRERSFPFPKPKVFESNKYKFVKPPKKEFSSTHELLATVIDKKATNCIFCNQDHRSDLCSTLDVEEKRNILKSQGRCYLCLQKKHLIKNCESKQKCSCGGRHNRAICFKNNLKSNVRSDKKVETINQKEANTNSSEEVVSAISCIEKNKILLQTCTVKAKNKNRKTLIRLLLDTGSMKTFLLKSVSDRLQLKVIRQENLSVFTFGNKEPIKKTYDVVNLKLENRNCLNSKLEIEALVTDSISGSYIPPPEINDVKQLGDFQNLTLADSPQCEVPITLLIGADYYYDIVTGNLKHLNKNLIAIETIFGWCLQNKKSENQLLLNFNVIVEEHLISEQIKKFWDLESSGIINTKQDTDPSESEIMKKFEADIEYEDNRYKVKLPWKLKKQYLNDNRKIAEDRLTKLNRKFVRNPQLFFKYKEVLQDYLNQGIIELVPKSENKEYVNFYLPHREVIKMDRVTSKLRIVFDASSHDVNSLSLNDCLYSGPNLYPEIFDILMRFRLHPIAFTMDMKQAFLQILVNEEDRDVSRFLFSEDPLDNAKPPEIYKFTRVLFGVNCSPFLLAATIKYHLKNYIEKYPETVDFLNKNIYVDDIIGSVSSVEQALSTTSEAIEIFKSASMQLHKMHTNSKLLLESWKENNIVSDEYAESLQTENNPYKVLGIAWNSLNDCLYFDIRELEEFTSKKINTKRFILQVLGRIYDPLGFLGPFTLRVKCIMQKLWSLGTDWDEVIPEELTKTWKNWCDEVPQLKNISIPRYYYSEIVNINIANLELHVFSDSSTIAFGTVAYLRAITTEGDIQTVFVASKNRVAPLKSLTLPKLELMAALCSARLSCSILEALKLEIPCFFWTDSKITYFWIKGAPGKFKPFVRNRVEEIQKLTSPSNWRHCPGVNNPADLVSRGTKIAKLINDRTWLYGPNWLSLPSEFWPKPDEEVISENQLEYRKNQDIIQYACVIEEIKNPIDITKFSKFEKLVRITALVKRFIMKLKKSSKAHGTLTAEELTEAENYLIKSEQKQFYKNDIQNLKSGNSVEKNSPLFNFFPYIDENEFLRLGGRLEFSNLSLEETHPIILPKHSWLTTLIVQRDHEKMMHAGIASTLSKIRSKYWIPKGRQLVKSIIKKCLICKKYLSKPADQITAPLPRDRVNESPPFSVCGLDYAGPIYVKNLNKSQKSYILLITCGVTRSLHLELVADLTTESFLLAFRRFLARRLNCKIIYSDNAKTFKKAKREIENLYDILSSNSVLKFLAKERIVWKNIIERAAWWGGFYERLVKSVKECLRKIVGKALLNFEEMSTLLIEVETILNLRPLTYVYNENEEPEPLTPMHFLNFGKEISLPVNFFDVIEDGSKRSSLLKRKRYQSLLLRQLWFKWKNQYLLDLKTAHSLKNPVSHTPLKVGDVVLVEGDNKNKFLWKLGRIQKAMLGRDQNIRSYEVKTANGVLKRTIQHLYPLEIQTDEHF